MKQRYWALVDVDNCYVSCERSFRPDLNGKPCVVLSNNDGCVIARSNEAKRMGVASGTPFFKLKQLFPGQTIYAFSSNYELYADMTRRLMNTVRNSCNEFHRYSIDEGFCILDDLDASSLREWGEGLYKTILRGLGMPVSIGIARTKTLAKMASKYAKRYAGYHHCCIIDDEEKRLKALENFKIEDVWGIGRRWSEHLQRIQVHTALAYAQLPQSYIRAAFNVVAERTWKELNGIDCIPVDDMEMTTKKSVCTSRSFPEMITHVEQLKTHVANYAARCAEKIRKQHSVAQSVGVFIDTNHFRDDLPQYGMFRSMTLLTPTNSTQSIVKCALQCLDKAFIQGYHYKRAGVMLMGLIGEHGIQTNFKDYDAEKYKKMQRLDKVIDHINRQNGIETVVLGAQQYKEKDAQGKALHFADAIKRAKKSPNYTTQWDDILVVGETLPKTKN